MHAGGTGGVDQNVEATELGDRFPTTLCAPSKVRVSPETNAAPCGVWA